MSAPQGVTITDTGAEGIDLYVNYEGLEGLRDNTTRPYSKFFDNLITQVDELQAEKNDPAPEQDPLPGL